MERYKFTDTISESIVTGITKGYKSYLNERKQKKEELIISSAYAWVKGNHIDHHVAVETKPFGVTYIPSKAGYSWGYLQFHNIHDNVLFLIKNSSFSLKNKKERKQNQEDNYIEKLAKLNHHVDFKSASISANRNKQLELNLFDHIQVNPHSIEAEIEQLHDQFDRFYIVTYTLDEQKMIADISLCLPHPEMDELYQVDSWNRFLETIDIDFTEEDFAGIRDDKEMETQVSIGNYGIVIQDEDKASDTES